MRINSRITICQRFLSVIAGIFFVLCAWKFALLMHVVPSLLLPEPLAVVEGLSSLFMSAKFWDDLLATLWAWLGGTIAGTAIGCVLGVAVAVNRFIWAAVEPWVEFIRALPSVVLVPLVSLFLGVGASSRFVCSSLVVATILISTAGTALRAVSQAHLRLAIAWRATVLQTVTHFLIPAMISHMAVSLKAAIPIALIVTVAADMLIATDAGVGKIIMDSLAIFDTATMYAAVLVLGLLGYVAAALGTAIERIAVHWTGQ